MTPAVAFCVPCPIIGYRTRDTTYAVEAVLEHFPDARNIVRVLGAVHFDAPRIDRLPPWIERCPA